MKTISKSSKKLKALLGACLVGVLCMTGCGAAAGAGSSGNDAGNGTGTGAGGSNTTVNTELSGSIQLVGSTSMEKLSNALAESFMDKYPDVEVTAEFVGSGAGIEAVTTGTADIGNSSRNLKDTEKAAGAVENVVAIDGIAVCTHKDNTVTNLTVQQLKDIYTGKVTNWSELGGKDAPIIVV